jgi:hypothetical protein
MGARNQVRKGFSYRPAVLHRLAESIPWNRFLGFLKFQKYHLWKRLIQAVNRIPKGFFHGITYPVIYIYQRDFHVLYMIFLFFYSRENRAKQNREINMEKSRINILRIYEKLSADVFSGRRDLRFWIDFCCNCISMFLFEQNYVFSVVEDEGGALTNMTVLTWQIGLGETLCYR